MKDCFGREISYLRLSVTDLCNLRCRYCMPETGVCKKAHSDMMTEEETLQALSVAAELGITKVRITGGEPLIKPNILSLCHGAAAIDGIREVCLTTNGTLLPKLAVPLREAGVQRINLSLDTLNREKYRRLTGQDALEQALRGLDAALNAGFQKVKLNCVLIGGFNDEEVPAMADLTRRYPLDVRFIELMPIHRETVFPSEAYLPCSSVLSQLPEAEAVQPDGVAARYRLPGAQGTVGLITPLSHHFCGSCSRLRLTADGFLRPCLHSPLSFSIRGLTKDALRERFVEAIRQKPAGHKGLSPEHPSLSDRTMNQIGG